MDSKSTQNYEKKNNFRDLYDEASNVTVNECVLNYIQTLENFSEPILADDDNKFLVGNYSDPVQSQIWGFYKRHQKANWKAEEVAMGNDLNDFNTIFGQNTDEKTRLKNEAAKNILKHILAFFANADGIVRENIIQRFMTDVKLSSAQVYYTFQAAMENVHAESYTIQLTTLIQDPQERTKLLNAIYTIPAVKKKALWFLKYLSNPDKDHYINKIESFPLRLFAAGIAENVHFAGSFAVIFWIKTFGKMKGLAEYNRLISRDEGLHFEFAAFLYSHLKNKLPESVAVSVMKEAVEIEEIFFREAIKIDLIGMLYKDMVTYIKYMANETMKTYGYQEIYKGVSNPFEFMNMIDLPHKNNMHEVHPSEYGMSFIGNKDGEDEVRFDAEF